ncbi:MAG: alpha/beta hydrolase [Chitinophagaceae bacterium]
MKYFLVLVVLSVVNFKIQAQSIDVSYSIKINGINQWVNVKGKDVRKPLLLWLCGGPGSSVINGSDKFTSKLQENFIVVQWDQRETGKTLSLNKSDQPLTLHLFEQDTHDIIDSLLNQFHYKKIYLAGHSWGTALGFYIADKYPELLYAFIAISPMINQTESERMTLSMLLERATKRNKKREIEELSQVKIPFETGEQLYFDRKWLFSFNGQKLLGITFPKSFALGWAATWLPVFNEASAVNLFISAPEIKCPVYFFAGRKDYQTHFSITEDYFNKVIAPKKELFWFENSGHQIPNSEPGMMQDIIITRILPQTFE